MNRDDYLRALLQPVEWTPTIAAKQLAVPVAAVRWLDQPQLHTRKPPTKLIPRRGRLVDEQPTQVWARYLDWDEIAFVVTSVRTPGIWNEASSHRVNVFTALQPIDPQGSEYLMDQYESKDAFAYVIGIPDFLTAVKRDGLDWVEH
jgi:hypothetical protein